MLVSDGRPVQSGGMLIRIPTPGDVLGVARSTAGLVVGAATTAASVPGRVLGLVDGAETVLGRITDIADRVDGLIDRVEQVAASTEKTVGEVDGVIDRTRSVVGLAEDSVREVTRITTAAAALVTEADAVTQRAAGTVESAQRTAGVADGLLATYEPIARKAAPMAEQFVDELSQKEVDAAIRLVDELPVIAEHMISDILPILRTLDRVGPEVHELLEVTHDVRRAIVGIPGFQFFRRRGEDRVVTEERSGNDDHFRR